MTEAFAAALAHPGIAWVFATSLIAGVVYGFAGFGSALIFMPIAVRVLPPEVAIGAFSLSALASFFTVVPGAWASADRRGAAEMLAAAFVATPLGVWLLRNAETDAIRTAVAVIVLGTLAALLAGWRFPVAPGRGARLGVGAASGVFGGATGLNGPVVILFNLGAGHDAGRVRANTAVFLTISSLSFLPQLWIQGLLSSGTVALGFLLLIPYAVGTRAGVILFRPGRESLYRAVAYVIIAAAGLAGLPIWG